MTQTQTQNVVTHSGVVHLGEMRRHPFDPSTRILLPACGAGGRGRLHYAIPTDQPVTCKKCGGS